MRRVPLGRRCRRAPLPRAGARHRLPARARQRRGRGGAVPHRSQDGGGRRYAAGRQAPVHRKAGVLLPAGDRRHDRRQNVGTGRAGGLREGVRAGLRAGAAGGAAHGGLPLRADQPPAPRQPVAPAAVRSATLRRSSAGQPGGGGGGAPRRHSAGDRRGGRGAGARLRLADRQHDPRPVHAARDAGPAKRGGECRDLAAGPRHHLHAGIPERRPLRRHLGRPARSVGLLRDPGDLRRRAARRALLSDRVRARHPVHAGGAGHGRRGQGLPHRAGGRLGERFRPRAPPLPLKRGRRRPQPHAAGRRPPRRSLIIDIVRRYQEASGTPTC